MQEQIRCLTRADREVLLHLAPLAAAEGRIGEDDVVAVFLLNIHHVLIERVGVDQVRGFDPVQDHVHDPDDVGEALLFLPVEGFGLKGLELGRRELVCTHVIISFAEEACTAHRAVIDRFTDLGSRNPDHGMDQGTRGVILASVAPCVAHAADARLVQL